MNKMMLLLGILPALSFAAYGDYSGGGCCCSTGLILLLVGAMVFVKRD